MEEKRRRYRFSKATTTGYVRGQTMLFHPNSLEDPPFRVERMSLTILAKIKIRQIFKT